MLLSASVNAPWANSSALSVLYLALCCLYETTNKEISVAFSSLPDKGVAKQHEPALVPAAFSVFFQQPSFALN
jgi:hypothetical protein